MSKKTLGVIDYGSGNLRSVCKAIEAAGAAAPLITPASGLDHLDGIVVPGQGAFHQCAANLRASGLWDPVREWTLAGRPYLGICLGYQLLFESSEESPGVSGLGVLKGRVVRSKFPTWAGMPCKMSLARFTRIFLRMFRCILFIRFTLSRRIPMS